jgi:hypothetical protein
MLGEHLDEQRLARYSPDTIHPPITLPLSRMKIWIRR